MNESLVQLCEDLGVSLAQLETALRETDAQCDEALLALREQGEAQLRVIEAALAQRRVEQK